MFLLRGTYVRCSWLKVTRSDGQCDIIRAVWLALPRNGAKDLSLVCLGKLVAAPPAVGKLVAWNPVEGREVWHATHTGVESGGVLATAGDLVFQGRSDGILLAYDASDGKQLWEFDTGTGILAPL